MIKKWYSWLANKLDIVTMWFMNKMNYFFLCFFGAIAIGAAIAGNWIIAWYNGCISFQYILLEGTKREREFWQDLTRIHEKVSVDKLNCILEICHVAIQHGVPYQKLNRILKRHGVEIINSWRDFDDKHGPKARRKKIKAAVDWVKDLNDKLKEISKPPEPRLPQDAH